MMYYGIMQYYFNSEKKELNELEHGALVRLKNISVKFDEDQILDNLSLDINEKEFVTLLGPSGCGKTTTLRILGGFVKPDSGEVLFEGGKINDVPPYQRQINTIFQKYALFPHLNVFENVAFGLRVQKKDEKEIKKTVNEMLELVNLKGFGKRDINSLSGGQQQRVSIARALAVKPRVLLLDEPLGALDLKLRKDMQVELKNIQQRLGITFVYVTHDQEEALTMSDTVVVMKDGLIQQIGTPEDIYNEPTNPFLADFIGESNILPGLMLKDYMVRFEGVDFPAFKGRPVRGIVADCRGKSKKFFVDSLKFATSAEVGLGGLGYITLKDGVFAGPIAKFLSEEKLNAAKAFFSLNDGDAVFLMAGEVNKLNKFAGKARMKLGEELDLIEKDAYRFCWIVDFPMFEQNEETGAIEFSHNPFSMPQGGMDSLLNKNPLDILAYQYDIVCNGIELSSGAVRNHKPEIMYKAFEIAGYDNSIVDNKFGGMINAFKYGAPPHAGCAPGVDRTIMILADEPNIREVILFPMNGKAQDLMMQAPNTVTEQQLKELHIKIVND